MTPEQSQSKNVKKREPRIWADDELNLHPERRAYERIPADLQARLFYGNLIYTGMVTNLSDNGMFISTKVKFPVNSKFMVVVLLNERTLKIPIKVRRTVRSDIPDGCLDNNGMGVELLSAPQYYLDFVSNCKSSI